jgi:addiction module HigA family antidote
MQKISQTPGAVLNGLLAKHGLNCNRLAKAINMSNAMVRLLILDKSPISVSAAFRLAKFFKTKPEYWLALQMNYDLSKASKDKKLAKEVSGISDVSKFSFVRKPHASKAGKKKTAGKKPGRKPGRKAAVKKAPGRGRKKATLADKRKAAGKVPGAKPARRGRRAKK